MWPSDSTQVSARALPGGSTCSRVLGAPMAQLVPWAEVSLLPPGLSCSWFRGQTPACCPLGSAEAGSLGRHQPAAPGCAAWQGAGACRGRRDSCAFRRAHLDQLWGAEHVEVPAAVR